MNANLQTVTINLQGKGRVGDYAKHVIRHGHVPGVLSGSELTGKARQYNVGYAKQRAKAAQLVASFGVQIGYAKNENSRNVRVWVSAETGEPVRLDYTL